MQFIHTILLIFNNGCHNDRDHFGSIVLFMKLYTVNVYMFTLQAITIVT